MLNQLVEYGKHIRSGASDALKEEPYEITLTISDDGEFISWNTHERKLALVELITAKKGKARLLLDKPEEVLGLYKKEKSDKDEGDKKKHELFLEKLKEYIHVPALKPLLCFYEGDGIVNARAAFEKDVPEKQRNGNIAFLVLGEDILLHEHEEVIQEVEKKYAEKQMGLNKRRCSVCGSDLYPVTEEPHGMIKGVPKGQPSGSALISFNMTAFESYGLTSNLNASVCTACARNYVIALNTLLNDGVERLNEKEKKRFDHFNRKNLSRDTAMVFWTKSGSKVKEIDYPDSTKENLSKIQQLLEVSNRKKPLSNEGDYRKFLNTPAKGAKDIKIAKIDKDRFYSISLSGAAARIAIRDFIETSTETIADCIAEWFSDIKIVKTNFDTRVQEIVYPPISALSNSCAVHTQEGDRYKCDYDDPVIGHTSVLLWKAALTYASLPISLLDRVLRRIRLECGRVTTARASLIKIILIRGEQTMSDLSDKEPAYIAGRIFALFDRIQVLALEEPHEKDKASEKKINSPIRDLFYSAASTFPNQTLGRLRSKLTNHHLSKLRKEKYGLYVNVEKELTALYANIGSEGFPLIFSLKDQGLFAIGYYHQQQENFAKKGESNEQHS